MRFCSVLLAFVCAGPVLAADSKPTAEAVEFFEKKVRPVLAEQCYSCHGAKKQSASLRLDRKADFLKGGDNGPAVAAQDSFEGGIVSSGSHSPDHQPVRALPSRTGCAWPN